MKDQRKTEIRVGITAALAIVVLIAVFSWAKNFSLYGGEKTVSVRFESTAGLEKGDPVTINGVRKGFVDDIIIDGNSVIVRTVIDSDVELKKDASFAISMLDLMGGKKIEVKPGTSAGRLDWSKMQNGEFYADIPAVMAMLGSVQNDLVNIIKDVRVSLTSINKVLADKDFDQQIKTSLSNLAEVSGKLNAMIDENRSNIKSMTSNGARLADQSADFFEKNKASITRTLEDTETILKNTNELVLRLQKLTDETTSGGNNLGKLLYDKSLADDLKTTLQQVKELTELFREQIRGEGLKVKADVDLF